MVAADKARNPIESTNSSLKAKEADLEVQFSIKPGFKGVQYSAAIPGFELAGAKLKPKTSKTRVMIGMQFTNRNVMEAKLSIKLYDDNDNLLAETSRVEKIGPEKVITKGHNLDRVQKWNDHRALWLDFPKKADKTTAIRVRVELSRSKVIKK